jgi:hypothetical protein
MPGALQLHAGIDRLAAACSRMTHLLSRRAESEFMPLRARCCCAVSRHAAPHGVVILLVSTACMYLACFVPAYVHACACELRVTLVCMLRGLIAALIPVKTWSNLAAPGRSSVLPECSCLVHMSCAKHTAH